MNNVINKIIEKLEDKRNKYSDLADGSNFNGFHSEDIEYTAKTEMCEEMIEIINQVVEEHNNGWILCNEQMPEEYESVFSKYKGTDSWKPCMFEKASDLVSVTVTNKKGEVVTCYMHTRDGEWSGLKDDNTVIAWQPLPYPYKEKTN